MDLASSIASIVSGPAVDGSVDLTVQLAHVALIENLDVVGGVFGPEAVIFVAVIAIVRVDELVENFVESVDVSVRPGSVFWERCSDSLNIEFSDFYT